MRATVTREQVLEAIAKRASELKRTPTKKEFRALTGISEKAVCTRFGSFGSALRVAGLVTVGPGYQTSDEDLLKDGERWCGSWKWRHRLPTAD